MPEINIYKHETVILKIRKLTSKINKGKISITNKVLTPLLTLSSGQEEVFNFVKDPICAINFWKLDNELGKKVLKLHYDFWTWRFNGERETE